MGERVAKILILINPEMNLEAYDITEDYVALSNECASAGRWEDVAAVREVMNDKGMENKVAVVVFSMLGGDCGVKVSDRTLVCVLSAVSRVGCLETGVGVHGYIVKTMCDVENDVYLGTGLVDMYVKCGCWDSALYVFRSMGMNLEAFNNTEDYVALSNECASAVTSVASEIKSEAKNQNKFINQLQMTLIKA
nr:pentatricopeptide repeat-containing protein At3g18970 [Tanacetum cinerariifolium]